MPVEPEGNRTWPQRADLHLGSRMGVLSVTSFALNYGLFVALSQGLAVRAEVAAGLAMMLVMAANFAGCRYYVFRAWQGDLKSQALRFATGTLVFRGAELASFATVIALTHWNGLIVYPATLLVFFVVKLLVYGRFVFNGPAPGH